MMGNFTKPEEIERESMAVIARELEARGIIPAAGTENIVKRVIHATADFDFAENLRFTPDAVSQGIAAMKNGMIVTDTNMALAGINRNALSRMGGEACCFMAEEWIAQKAKKKKTTRAAVSMDTALERFPNAILAVGNAPTALLRIAERIEAGARPAIVIGVPVGFVNVTESKKRIWNICRTYEIPAIVSFGRKGGSSVAAAVCNAMIYDALRVIPVF